ncbi:hypothetical protein JIG36_01510 [Actinoplanes sp. LDG1-06]|uniref:Uncharacterized protein n=1 Tax=Paractinoplanes ovalisporus TaxID=2810368 RepID=A0ABS2A314_9ACTN|nr:hypothetical protein [Actinoplanes ovalisporus]MBM2614232.1 hypothetical protein [Actinoplanes ovalisporus]
MSWELVRFLRLRLDEDEHVAAEGAELCLDSTGPLLDAVRAVVDLYADVEALDTPGGCGADAFAAGRAAGLGLAVRTLAAAYHHHHPAFLDM